MTVKGPTPAKFPVFASAPNTFTTWAKGLARVALVAWGLDTEWKKWNPVPVTAGNVGVSSTNFVIASSSIFEYLLIPFWGICLVRINCEGSAIGVGRPEIIVRPIPSVIPKFGPNNFNDTLSGQIEDAGFSGNAQVYVNSSGNFIIKKADNSGILPVAGGGTTFSVTGFFRVKT